MKNFILASVTALGIICYSIVAWAETINTNIAVDPAFNAYVSPELLQLATDSADPELLTDVALQLMEGERILMRPHQEISSEEVMRLAYRLATLQTTKDRLKAVADKTEKNNLLDEFAKFDQEIEANLAKVKAPTFSVEENSAAEAVLKEILDNTEKAIRLQDRILLNGVENSVQDSKAILGEVVAAEVTEYLTEVKANIVENPSEEANSFVKLDGVSRAVRVPVNGGDRVLPERFPGAGSMRRPVPDLQGGGTIPRRPPGRDQLPDSSGLRVPRVRDGEIEIPGGWGDVPTGEVLGPERASSRTISPRTRQIMNELRNGSFRFEMNEGFRKLTARRGPSSGVANVDGMQVRYRSYQQQPGTRRYNPNWLSSAQLMDAPPIPPNTSLSQWRRQIYKEAQKASQFWGYDFPISMRTGIQFYPIDDQFGNLTGDAIVIGVTSWSPVRSRIKVGDIITAIDGNPIYDEWEFEQHYRVTEFEFIDLDTMNWRIRNFWLGLF